MPDSADRDPTDEQRMLAYARGEAAAFDCLYARQEAALLRFVRRLLGQRWVAQSEEVFQDTWMRIIAARGQYAPQGPQQDRASWKTWAYTIAHHAAMDRLRVSGREVRLDSAEDNSDAMDWLQATLDLAPAPPAAQRSAAQRSGGMPSCGPPMQRCGRR